MGTEATSLGLMQIFKSLRSLYIKRFQRRLRISYISETSYERQVHSKLFLFFKKGTESMEIEIFFSTSREKLVNGIFSTRIQAFPNFF